MPMGIENVSTITMKNLTDIVNITDEPMHFFINVNNMVYGGLLYFILLLILWFIIAIGLQQKKPQIWINIMYSGAVVSIVSFFLRAIFIIELGVVKGLLTDWQMWFFPIITILIAAWLWFSRD